MLAVWKEGDDIEVFESGWTFDHFYPIFSDPAGPCLEGWVTTTAAARPVISRTDGHGLSRFSRMEVPYMPWFFDRAEPASDSRNATSGAAFHLLDSVGTPGSHFAAR